MSDHLSFNCWRCGQLIPDVPLPLSRSETCSHCRADLHTCRQCVFYDTSKASACQEPVADHVSDKTRANFCGYLSINTMLTANASEDSCLSAELNALFGLDAEASNASPGDADAAQSALDDLFGLGESKPE